MGTINYKTSDYITIGYNCDFIDYDDEFYFDDINEFYEMVKNRLNLEYFYYYNIKVVPGYYEGFSIDIEFNYKWCFDDYRDKREAQKEITQIKKFLLECINDFELYVVFPGWCTTYKNRIESIKLLNEAIKEMRQEVKNTRTYRTLPESEKC